MTGKTHMMAVELPITSTHATDLLFAMVRALEIDAKRYMKAYKVDQNDPAVADKIDAATAIQLTANALKERRKKRWANENNPA